MHNFCKLHDAPLVASWVRFPSGTIQVSEHPVLVAFQVAQQLTDAFHIFSINMAPTTTAPGTVTADGRQESRITNYTKFWQNDMSKEKDADTANRLDSYTDVVNGAS